ncbi:hypothetical protein X801_09424, partial [Opisthorchis viverrini]
MNPDKRSPFGCTSQAERKWQKFLLATVTSIDSFHSSSLRHQTKRKSLKNCTILGDVSVEFK